MNPTLPRTAVTKTDAAKPSAEPDIAVDDLEDRLANLFADSEGPPVPKNPRPKPKTALPCKEKARDELKLTKKVAEKKASDVQTKLPAEQLRPAPIRIVAGGNRKRLYRNKFVSGGIAAVLAVAVVLILFRLFAGVAREEPHQTVTLRKIDSPPVKIQAKAAPSSPADVPAEKTDPATARQTPEADESAPLPETTGEALKAPAGLFPFSIHAASYRSLEAAEQSAQTFRNTALPAFRVRTDLGEKGVWHRVLIGCYKDLETAREIIKERQLNGARPVRISYANFIGAYLSDDDLVHQSRFLSERGYSPYFILDDNGVNYLYAGAFDTRAEAESFSVELRSGGIRSLVVER